MSIQRYFTGRQISDISEKNRNTLIGKSQDNPAKSPLQIKRIIGSPLSGTYWFSNSGFNSGNAFSAYVDFAIGDGYIIFCGLNKTDASTNNWSQWGTAATSVVGTPGFRNDFYLQSANLLSGWSGDTSNSFILGMTTQNGTSISDASDKRWFVINQNLSTAQQMFDNAPSVGQYTGSVKASSSGTTGSYYWTTSHGNSIYQMATSSDTVNANLWMETRDGGTDANHSAIVYGNNNGAYYISNPPFTSRWMFMGFSPNNL